MDFKDFKHQTNFMLFKCQSAGNSDYISNLPDPLLCYILSYIPTKSAVATCLLSKRWKTVWTKVPKLDFTEMPHLGSCCFLGPREELFDNFVDNVLTKNDMSSIKILRLHLFNGLRARRANSWLCDIMRRDIQEIDLTCHCPSVKLPTTFFNRERLVVLKLKSFSLDVPNSLNWPSLEYLHVIHARFSGEKSMKNLVSGCPALKELAIDSCRGISRLCISFSSLKTLEIKDTLTGNTNPVLIIEAPNLEILYLSDLADKYDFSSLSVDKVVLTIHDRGVNHREKLVELLRGICSLKFLKLGRVTTDVLHDLLHSRLPAFHDFKLPVFHDLVCLELAVGNWSIILQMLECAPNLTSLILYNVSHAAFDLLKYSYGSRTDWNPLPSVPNCLVFTLQEITVHHLTRDEGDMKVVGYLLQNALVLKRLKFSLVPYSLPEGFTDVVEKFRELSSRTSRCEIVLCQP